MRPLIVFLAAVVGLLAYRHRQLARSEHALGLRPRPGSATEPGEATGPRDLSGGDR